MVSYRQGSALDLPFETAAFDGAYMLHVGMNVADKARLFGKVRRLLKPGGDPPARADQSIVAWMTMRPRA